MSNRRDFLRQNLTFSGETDFESVNLTGNIGVDGGTPTVSLDLGSRTDSILLPKGTNAQRPSPPAAGMIRYNTELNQYELYDETITTWSKLGDQPPTISSISPVTTETVTGTTEFTVTGSNFESSGMTTQFVSTVDSTVVNRTAFGFDNSGQIRITFNNTDFDAAKEPYNLVVTKSSGLSATKLNALYVDEAPVWTLTSTNIATILPQAITNVNIDLPTATDPEGDTVTYSGSNLPSGLSIDANTGDLSGSVPASTSQVEYTVTVNALSTGSDPGAPQKTTTRQPTIIVKPVIENSLMFDGSSYLSRTPSVSGNTTTFTYSLWVKRGNFTPSNIQMLFEAKLDGVNYFVLFLQTDDKANLHSYHTSKTGEIISTQVFRDASAWYNFLFKVDTTLSTANDRYQLYVNGSRITELNTNTQPTQSYNTYTNTTNQHRIGAGQAAGQTFYGYLADIHFIDGQALGPTNFGESINGIWLPKVYNPTGTPLTDYGTNGFHLTFAPSTISGTTVQDVSGRGNDWTANGF